MAAPILPFPPHDLERCLCIRTTPPINTFRPAIICSFRPFEDYTPITKHRSKCEHCGATERLITGECAYCRQY
jgi:hypothetical protein